MALISSPDPACTSSSIFNLFHMPCGTDASAGILHEIFGDTISNLVPGMTAFGHQVLIPQFIQNFNAVLLTGVLFIFSIIVIAGTVNTGHHGKFLGQQWDSIWTPIRVIAGTACMVPLKFGIAAAQILVLMLILYGAHAASVVWGSSLNNVRFGTPPTVPASGMSIIKQAIANQLITETYNTVNGGAPSSTFNQPVTSTFSFFDPDASAIQAQARSRINDMCKAALQLTDHNGALLPDNQITGTQATQYSTCQKVADDTLQSNKPYFIDNSIPKNLFNGGQSPTSWIGQLPGYSDCISGPYFGTLNPSCLLFFPNRATGIAFYDKQTIAGEKGSA